MFTYHRTVRFQDTDAAGVVYFADVLKICHEAYEECLEIFGINIKDFFSKSAIAYPIIHADVDFFRPIHCGDKLEVKLMPQKITQDKFEIYYEIGIVDVVLAKAMTRHVCIDISTRKKIQFPDAMGNWLEEYSS